MRIHSGASTSVPSLSPSPSPTHSLLKLLNLPLGSYIHTRALLIALVYVSASLAPRDAQTSFFGLISFPMRYLPYVFIAMDLISSGPAAAAHAVTGAIVGHLWWWGVWDTRALREWGAAPALFAKLMGQEGDVQRVAPGVQVIPPRRIREEAASGSAGHNWGSGRRLGT